MIDKIKEYLEERLEVNIKAKNMFLEEIEKSESAKIDYFGAVAREREVQNIIIFIQALEKASEDHE